MTAADARSLAAFEACWETYMPRVLRYCQRHVGMDEAQDVAAETFAVAWRRWSEVPSPPIAWLLATARRLAQNHARSTRRADNLVQRLRYLDAVASRPSASTDAERLVALEALNQLGANDREALLLIAWDGLSVRDAADVLGISAAGVRKRVSRARQKLDRELPDEQITTIVQRVKEKS